MPDNSELRNSSTIRKSLPRLIAFAVAALSVACHVGFPSLSSNARAAIATHKFLYGTAVVYCFVAGQVTGNVSQTDKLWSVLPGIYMLTTAYQSGFSPRLTLMTSLVLIWGARLTFNFHRRGGYKGASRRPWEGEEDYRWTVVRSTELLQHRFVWLLFNLLFICIYQHALIYAFTLPAIVVLEYPNQPLSLFDFTLTFSFLLLLLIELISDNQQYQYQCYKRQPQQQRTSKEPALSEDNVSKGFIDSGLWSISRHPNYLAEQLLWCVIYAFSVSASGTIINWSALGMIPLITLFQASIHLTESISAEKYPQYKDYQRRVPMQVPFIRWF